MIVGLTILTFGATFFLINKGLKCASYLFGVGSLIIIGIGIGILIAEYFPILMLSNYTV